MNNWFRNVIGEPIVPFPYLVKSHISKESPNQNRKPPDESRGLNNFGCDACGVIAICGKCTLKYLINYGDYCCSEPLYLPKATSPAAFDSKNCSRAK